jgi:hypothetical protein
MMEKGFSQEVLSHGQRLPEVEQLLESLELLHSKAVCVLRFGIVFENCRHTIDCCCVVVAVVFLFVVF